MSRSTHCAPLLAPTEMLCVTSGRSLCLSVWLGLEEQPFGSLTGLLAGGLRPSRVLPSVVGASPAGVIRTERQRHCAAFCELVSGSHTSTPTYCSPQKRITKSSPCSTGGEHPRVRFWEVRIPRGGHVIGCLPWPGILGTGSCGLQIMLWLCWGVFRVNLVDSICQLY